MKLEKSIYPYNPEARTLPFFLFGIGGSEYQERVNRSELLVKWVLLKQME